MLTPTASTNSTTRSSHPLGVSSRTAGPGTAANRLLSGILLEDVLPRKHRTDYIHGLARNKRLQVLSELAGHVAGSTRTDAETIISISGTTDKTPASGLRVTSLKFSILNSRTGRPRIAGPFSGETGAPFSVNVACQFIALSGFAINTHKSLAQLHGQPGGLYGLVFDNTNFDLEY
ncbi:hypothetical protein C8F01DRAFT_1260464 [Mycena amicta]|nr:hypothetical protein C8F01DRAFT_1260464 [Mycena amicta]